MAHPDRVRRNNCPEHDWHLVPGVTRISAFHFVLDGFECWNCGTVISRNERTELSGCHSAVDPQVRSEGKLTTRA